MSNELEADLGPRQQGVSRAKNPFVSVAVPAVVHDGVEPDELWSHALSLAGPSSPAAAPRVDISGDKPWPTTTLETRPVVCVMGLHGGAGATAITDLIGQGAIDSERCWPSTNYPGSPVPVIGVARTNYGGIQQAARLARLWAAGALEGSALLGLVLIDDGPKLSPQQRSAVRKVGQMTPHGWHVPWQEAWRLDEPSYETSPFRVRRIIQHIRTLAQSTNGEPL